MTSMRWLGNVLRSKLPDGLSRLEQSPRAACTWSGLRTDGYSRTRLASAPSTSPTGPTPTPDSSRTAAAISSAPPMAAPRRRHGVRVGQEHGHHLRPRHVQRHQRGRPRGRAGRGQQRQSLRHHPAAAPAGDGTVFEWVKSTGTISVLASFNGTNGANPTPGWSRTAAAISSAPPRTAAAYGDGTVFEWVESTGTISVLASFNGANGAIPDAGLVEDSSGNLFGTTDGGRRATATARCSSGSRAPAPSPCSPASRHQRSRPRSRPHRGRAAAISSAPPPRRRQQQRRRHGVRVGQEHRHPLRARQLQRRQRSKPRGRAGRGQQRQSLRHHLLRRQRRLLARCSSGSRAPAPCPSSPASTAPTAPTPRPGWSRTPAAISSAPLQAVAPNADGTVFELSPNQPTATQLVVTAQPPASVGTGQAFSVQVSAEDANGNIVPGFTGNVTIQVASGPSNATLGGTLTVAADTGVATFSDVTLDTAGTYTLQATASGLMPATTAPFDVVAATQLVVTAQPPASVGTGQAFQVQVSAEDASGNVVPNFTGSVTIQVASGPSSATLGRNAHGSGREWRRYFFRRDP